MATTTTYPDVRFAGGPTYDNEGTIQLVPFSFTNGVLDVPSSFVSQMGATPLALGNDGVNVRRLGGNSLIRSLGSNLRTYLSRLPFVSEDGKTYTIGSGNLSTITVFQGGIVTKVQQLGYPNLPNAQTDIETYKVSTQAPIPNFIQYGSTFLFDKPLVIRATANITAGAPPGSTTIYITLTTQWDH